MGSLAAGAVQTMRAAIFDRRSPVLFLLIQGLLYAAFLCLDLFLPGSGCAFSGLWIPPGIRTEN